MSLPGSDGLCEDTLSCRQSFSLATMRVWSQMQMPEVEVEGLTSIVPDGADASSIHSRHLANLLQTSTAPEVGRCRLWIDEAERCFAEATVQAFALGLCTRAFVAGTNEAVDVWVCGRRGRHRLQATVVERFCKEGIRDAC